MCINFKKLKVGDTVTIIYEPGKRGSFNKLSVLFQMAVWMHFSLYLNKEYWGLNIECWELKIKTLVFKARYVEPIY